MTKTVKLSDQEIAILEKYEIRRAEMLNTLFDENTNDIKISVINGLICKNIDHAQELEIELLKYKGRDIENRIKEKKQKLNVFLGLIIMFSMSSSIALIMNPNLVTGVAFGTCVSMLYGWYRDLRKISFGSEIYSLESEK